MTTLQWLGLVLTLLPVLLLVYAYGLYPLILRAIAPAGNARKEQDPAQWPSITIAMPAYNEEKSIATTIESLLALEYPADRRQIVVMSDASSDRTDEIVQSYADRGVELVRMPQRTGKGQMENLAAHRFKGEIVVNTDATIRIPPDALKPLIRVFADPTLGCASGRDISVGRLDDKANQGESGYVGFEMWLRGLETRAGGIIGASGCYYAIRRPLVNESFPAELSRDFSAPLHTRLNGLRTVSVEDAVCLVPRARSLKAEYRRKVRTMARGLRTLFAFKRLLNPLSYGRFAWMLFSHKLARWLVFLFLPLMIPGLLLLSPTLPMALLVGTGLLTSALSALIAWRWPEGKPMPRLLSLPAFATLTCVAAFQSWMRAFSGRNDAIWEPTRR